MYWNNKFLRITEDFLEVIENDLVDSSDQYNNVKVKEFAYHFRQQIKNESEIEISKYKDEISDLEDARDEAEDEVGDLEDKLSDIRVDLLDIINDLCDDDIDEDTGEFLINLKTKIKNLYNYII